MVMVIAECGINHGGSEEVAYKLIDAAVAAGADVTKFQLFKPVGTREQYAYLCLPLDSYPRLNAYCKEKGIGFACTAFEAESLKWLLVHTQMALVKIGSGEIKGLYNCDKKKRLVLEAAISGLPVIFSTGGVNLNDFGCARFLLEKCKYSILHCVSEYPTAPQQADLSMLRKMSDFVCPGIEIGLSDHSGDIFMPLAAVALGAQIIESHITLDKEQEGPDHKASLNPDQFKEMARGIRAIEKGLT